MVSDSIPTDLVLEILLRLPAKSVARFHCVSKQWASMLSRPYFTELFLTRSSAQPRLIFAIEKDGLWSIFSLPHHQSLCEKSVLSSLVVTAEFHMKFPQDDKRICSREDRQFSCGYAGGLIYFYGMWTKEQDYYREVPVMFNPKTGRYAALPYLYRYRRTYSFLGFDPIDKQYKVLFMSCPYCSDRNKILTLGTGEMSWRRIRKCAVRHENVSEGICINGVVYYLGDTSEKLLKFVIVCFDVRSEKFDFIYPEGYCELINYMGKLGLVYYDDYADDVVELRLWVLENAEKQEWSKYAYTLRDDKFLDHYVSIVAVTATGEIVLSMADYKSKQPFYVFYFNPERNILRRVEIQGFGDYHDAVDNPSRVHVFVDDVFLKDCSRLYAYADNIEDLNVNDSMLLKSKLYEAIYPKIEEFVESESSDEEYNSDGDRVLKNRFSRFGSSFSVGESFPLDFSVGESLPLDGESVNSDGSDSKSGLMHHMTPFGQRLLRESQRPGQPSIKAKEVQDSSNVRGKGNRGRGNRGRGNRGRG